MTSHDQNFGQLQIGAIFHYHGQTYRKETEKSALMLRWANGDELTDEPVAHRFFEEIVVQVTDPEDENSSKNDDSGEKRRS